MGTAPLGSALSPHCPTHPRSFSCGRGMDVTASRPVSHQRCHSTQRERCHHQIQRWLRRKWGSKGKNPSCSQSDTGRCTLAWAEPPLAHRRCHILGFKLEQSFLRFPAALREASMDLSTGRRDEQTWSTFPLSGAWLVGNRQNLGSPAGRLQDDSSATSRDEIRKFEV